MALFSSLIAQKGRQYQPEGLSWEVCWRSQIPQKFCSNPVHTCRNERSEITSWAPKAIRQSGPSLLRFLRPWGAQKDIMQMSLKSVQHFLLSMRLHGAPKAETLPPHQGCEGLHSFFYHHTNSCSFGYQNLTDVAVTVSPEQLKSTFSACPPLTIQTTLPLLLQGSREVVTPSEIQLWHFPQMCWTVSALVFYLRPFPTWFFKVAEKQSWCSGWAAASLRTQKPDNSFFLQVCDLLHGYWMTSWRKLDLTSVRSGSRHTPPTPAFLSCSSTISVSKSNCDFPGINWLICW